MSTPPRDPLMEPPPPPGAPGAPSGRSGRSLLAKENRRLLLGLIIGALVAAFAVVNRDEVRVDWLATTSDTPLIIVIAASFLLGALAGWLAGAVSRRR